MSGRAVSKPTIISGPPYAGTSVVARALAGAGLDLGEEFQGLVVGDAAGEYTADGFVRMHHALLAETGTSWLSVPVRATPAVSPASLEAAASLLRQRARPGAWGWSDPRSILFLDLWDRLAAEPRWIFVLRRPAVSAWAQLRRQTLPVVGALPTTRLAAALDVWAGHTNLVLDFCARHPERSLLLLAPDHFDAAGESRLNEVVRARWAVEVAPIDLHGAYDRFLLAAATPGWVTLRTRMHREAARTWARAAVATEPRPAARAALSTGHRDAPDGVPRCTIALATASRFAASETFVRDHLNYLPATMKPLHTSNRRWRDQHCMQLASSFERVLRAASGEFGVQWRWLQDRPLRRYLVRHRIDAVLAEFGVNAVEFTEACAATEVPLVAHFHGYDVYLGPLINTYRDRYERLFEVAAGVVVVSQDMRLRLLELGAPEHRIVCNPCGVDTRVFSGADPAAAPPEFLSLGRFVDKKAPHNVLVAFRRVAERSAAARLVMAGDGPLAVACRELARSLGIAGRVSFVGRQPREQVLARMRRARAFVQHSVRGQGGDAEGTPVAVMEAGSCGLPVVATRHMGIADVIRDGETGLLVEEGDAEAMAEHMLALAEDPARAAAMGQLARQRVMAEFSRERSIARLWAVLEAAVNRSSMPRESDPIGPQEGRPR